MGGRAGAGHYQLSHLEALEAQSIHIMREVAAEFERPVLLFSGGKDSVVMLRLAEKAFWPARLPFPVMHVDTGHNFPEVLEFRDRRVAELDAQPDGGVGPGVDRQRAGRRGAGTQPLAQPPPDPDAARRHHRAPVRRRLRGRPPRRGEGSGQGAGVLVPGRVRAVGPEEPAARAVGPVQRAAPQPASTSGCSPCRTGPSSTSGSTSREEDIDDPVHLLLPPPQVFRRDGMLLAVGPVRDVARATRRSSRPPCATGRSAT